MSTVERLAEERQWAMTKVMQGIFGDLPVVTLDGLLTPGEVAAAILAADPSLVCDHPDAAAATQGTRESSDHWHDQFRQRLREDYAAEARQQGAREAVRALQAAVMALPVSTLDKALAPYYVKRHEVMHLFTLVLAEPPADEAGEPKPQMTDDCPDTCSRWPGCGHTEDDFR